MKATPSTTAILHSTKIQTKGEYLHIADLGDTTSLVAVGTPRLIKFLVLRPATELNDECKLKQVYQVRRNRFTARHVEFATEYALAGKAQSRFERNL